jgi:signal transduction histidine kinase
MQLKAQILLPILVVHLIVIPLAVYKFLVYFEQPTWQAEVFLADALLREVKHQIAMQQVISGTSVPNQLQKTTDVLAKTYQFDGLAVYNSRGMLKAHAGDTSMLKFQQATTRTHVSGSMIYATHWVENEPSCHFCHSPDQKYIGVIQAALSVEPLANKLAHDRRKAMLWTFGSLLAVFSLIYMFHRYFIVNPVGRILKGMNRVKAGDLSVRVPMNHKDEIGMLASGFNDVVHSLEAANAELERRHHSDMARAEQLATVGEIAAGLAHEVKNPVAGISSALQVMVSEMEESQNREVLVQAIDETHRITSTINSLLDYARPKVPKPEWVGVREFVTDVQTIFAPQCQQRRVKFQAVVDANMNGKNIYVDVQTLKQVVINLLRNSLEAVTSDGFIEFIAMPEKSGVRFQIRDNGPGMDALTKAKIFQPFYTTKPTGTGLGLSIVKRLVEDMNGTISVESRLGAGATFDIQLPKEGQS